MTEKIDYTNPHWAVCDKCHISSSSHGFWANYGFLICGSCFADMGLHDGTGQFMSMSVPAGTSLVVDADLQAQVDALVAEMGLESST